MSQVIVLHWNKNTLRAVVVGRHVAHSEVEAVLDIPLENDDDTESIGQQLKEALARYRPGRAKVVIAIGRDLLKWQHLDLPPCPEDDLPDLVYMQAGFDTTRTGEEIGFDFLPLAGDDQSPHRVLAISLQHEELTQLQDICEAADLTPKRFVPLSLGWPAAARRATRGDEQPVAIFVAPFAQESTIWATIGGRLVLFRQVHFPSADELPELSSTVGAELRRTMFALAQQFPEHSGASAWIVGKRPDEVSQIAETLDEQLDFDVQPMDFASDSALLSTKMSAEASTSDTLPLAGLALDEAAGNAPLVDLFHPRKRPPPRAGKRTYSLAASVLIALLAYGGWNGYTVLNAPVVIADVAQAELDLLKKSEKKLRADEGFADLIRDWQDDSLNILTELQQLSVKLRPLKLDAEGFNVDQDVVLENFYVNGTHLDMDAALRNYPAVGDFLDRLQDWKRQAKRDTAEERGSPPDYDVWLIHASIDFSDEAEQEESLKK